MKFGNDIEQIPADTLHDMGLHIDQNLLRPESGRFERNEAAIRMKQTKSKMKIKQIAPVIGKQI